MFWASSLLAASRRTSLVIQEPHWAPVRAPAVKINVSGTSDVTRAQPGSS